ncbi:cytidylate kinase-like family protein [uncultured Tyzzerella sp.]|uniref:cytidylate kinase-like family protein n=1 Tax=uncultured Tyzzerella sp. TaxID=2321398 RepID=UPI002943F79D|nr:cytidylate kinase-like family protein [uncultured Tyzzerella sp.]
MKNIIFAILEEEQSNGKLIAQKLSKELNIPLYDNEIIELACKNSNISKNIFYTIEDWKLNKAIPPLPIDFCIGFNLSFFTEFIPIQDKVFIEKSKALKQLVENKSCVVFCKASNYILKNYKNCIKVLVYSKDDDRLKNIVKSLNISEKNSKKFLKKQDKKLSCYYGYYTCENWDNKKCYDIFLNSSSLGINNCVYILKCVYNQSING